MTQFTKTLILTASLLVLAMPLAGQSAPRLWAAQTGRDEVTLSWDSIPGTTEYWIYLSAPREPGGPVQQPPAMRLSGTGQRAVLTGIKRLSNGIYLVAVDANGRVLQQAQFNQVAAATASSPVARPAEVMAEATSATEVTVSWSAVPGASAYLILRAVGGSGYGIICHLCSTETRYVDRSVKAGLRHSYMVSAIFPSGVSGRTTSKPVTSGVTQVASVANSPATGLLQPGTQPFPQPVQQPSTSATPSTGTTMTTTGATTTSTGTTTPWTGPTTPVVVAQAGTGIIDTKPMSTGTPVAGMAADNTNVGASTGTPMTGSTGCTVGTSTGTGSSVPTRKDPAPSAADDTVERLDPRAGRIEARTTTNPDASTPTTLAGGTADPGSAEYQQGKCLNPGMVGYPGLWEPVAVASGMTSAERIAAWKEIGVVALEYKHILGRTPTPDETRRDVATLKAGTTWKQLWRQLAHSAEREARFGYWAPAPIPDSLQAQRDFGTAVPPWSPQQCNGGLGDRCNGMIPSLINDLVAPSWFNAFSMPDNTELAYVEMGVAVGSILHDNACLSHKEGLNCDGVGLGDAWKTGLIAAELEWNKASWNVIDHRTWRETFGPYPTDQGIRQRDWYDDLRPAPPRPAMMAQALSMLTEPVLTVKPTVDETRQTRQLQAPGLTSLDDTDVAFCRSGAFRSTGWFFGKAAWGICK